jgi:hypothetical protein
MSFRYNGWFIGLFLMSHLIKLSVLVTWTAWCICDSFSTHTPLGWGMLSSYPVYVSRLGWFFQLFPLFSIRGLCGDVTAVISNEKNREFCGRLKMMSNFASAHLLHERNVFTCHKCRTWDPRLTSLAKEVVPKISVILKNLMTSASFQPTSTLPPDYQGRLQ